MELYTDTSYELARVLTLRYSTSFGQSTKLFSKDIQKHIFAIYGLVRIADEIVDTYEGSSKANELTSFEKQTYTALEKGYSTNPIVHAFANTANEYGIEKDLIEPFFESMRMDLRPIQYSQDKYKAYIYGSAEVIGLMCLRVFTNGNAAQFKRLVPSASALGSAYQKVNFLRDFASDYKERQRVYFPGVTFDTFNEAAKNAIIKDIKKDFKQALPGLAKLPVSAQKAVGLSYAYYGELLNKLEITPAETIKTTRIRVPALQKAVLLAKTSLRRST